MLGGKLFLFSSKCYYLLFVIAIFFFICLNSLALYTFVSCYERKPDARRIKKNMKKLKKKKEVEKAQYTKQEYNVCICMHICVGMFTSTITGECVFR